MGLSVQALLVTYVVGGLTFVPVLLALGLAFIFYTSPVVSPPLKTGTFIPSDQLEALAKGKDEEEGQQTTTLYRAGWLTARRTYDPVVPAGDGTYVSMMYRFMDTTKSSRDPRKARPKDDFFAVLKQNVLFLYDNEDQTDCWAVIDVTLHKVELFPELGVDGELFVRRNAVCLSLRDAERKGTTEKLVLDAGDGEQTQQALPWFLFARVNSDKEDWYHSLVKASKLNQPHSLKQDQLLFNPEDMASLIEGIDQQPDSLPMRWLNALIGRIFLSAYRTEAVEAYIIRKIVKKLKRVKTPTMLSEIKVREVNVGNSIPFFSKPMLKELTADGDASMELAVKYTGNARVTIETVATINLGARFKPYTVRLVLAVVLKEIEGTLLLKIKKPPSNRLWYGFSTMPRMVLSVEPVVSTRQIKWSLITSPIESRIREIVMESMVVPHMDDFSFFNTLGLEGRGGIWGEALRKEVNLQGPTAEEAAAQEIANTDVLKDEDVNSAPTPEGAVASTSTVNDHEAAAAEAARIRPRRRRSSDGDRALFTASTAIAANRVAPQASTSSFSLSSWSSKDKSAASAAAGGGGNNKRNSWFSTAPRSSTTSSLHSGGGGDESGAGRTPEPEKEASVSAARLRELLNKRAEDRKREASADGDSTGPATGGSLTPASLDAPRFPRTASSSSNLSLTAPKDLNGDHLPSAVSPSEDDEAVTPHIGASKELPSQPIDIASVVAGGSEPISFPSTSSSMSSTDFALLASDMSSSPATPPRMPSRPSFHRPDGASPPQALRKGHQTTQSDVPMSMASAASTASLLASWRSKATDKQAIAAGVNDAKSAVKRWGAAWNARRQGELPEEQQEQQQAAQSPEADMGKVFPSSSRSSSRSPLPGYREFVANKQGVPGEDADQASAPISIGTEKKNGASSARDRATSLSTSPGHFTPSPSFPTTKLSIASSSPSPAQPIVKAYQAQSMMSIPGIRDSSRAKAVASDHVAGGKEEPAAAAVEVKPVVVAPSEGITSSPSSSLISLPSSLPEISTQSITEETSPAAAKPVKPQQAAPEALSPERQPPPVPSPDRKPPPVPPRINRVPATPVRPGPSLPPRPAVEPEASAPMPVTEVPLIGETKLDDQQSEDVFAAPVTRSEPRRVPPPPPLPRVPRAAQVEEATVEPTVVAVQEQEPRVAAQEVEAPVVEPAEPELPLAEEPRLLPLVPKVVKEEAQPAELVEEDRSNRDSPFDDQTPKKAANGGPAVPPPLVQLQEEQPEDGIAQPPEETGDFDEAGWGLDDVDQPPSGAGSPSRERGKGQEGKEDENSGSLI